jgi:uncharacterized protein
MTTPADQPPGPDDPETTPPARPQAPGYGAPPPQAPGYGAPPPQRTGPAGPPPGWGPPPAWQQQGAGPGGVSSEDTTWALLAHLSFFVLGLIGPLIIFLVKKDTSPFVRQHAAEALNFHITVTLACIASAILIIVLIGVLLLLAVLIAGAVLAVVAAVAANRGEPYRYPFTLRLVT